MIQTSIDRTLKLSHKATCMICFVYPPHILCVCVCSEKEVMFWGDKHRACLLLLLSDLFCHCPFSSHTICYHVTATTSIDPLTRCPSSDWSLLQNGDPDDSLNSKSLSPIHCDRHMPNVFLLMICLSQGQWKVLLACVSHVPFLSRDVIKC